MSEHCKGHWLAGLRAAACGFLLGRGLYGGALSVSWSMGALLSGGLGRLYGAVLFAVACAVVCVVRTGFGRTANTLLNGGVLCFFVLWQRLAFASAWLSEAAVGGVLVAAALLFVCGRPHGVASALWICFFAAAGVLAPLPLNDAALRMTALCSCLASAGLTGSAVDMISRSEGGLSWWWMVAGAGGALLL